MPISHKISSVWEENSGVWVKVSGSWKVVEQLSIKQSGIWQPILNSSFDLVISVDQTDLDLRAYALSNGWDSTSNLIVTIDSGVIISGSVAGTAGYALEVSGSFPSGVTLINKGVIVGRGGAGGRGLVGSTFGGAGGTAIRVTSALTIDNGNGEILGGGGGGGGGKSGTVDLKDSIYGGGGGGGGGRSSNISSTGGAGGDGWNVNVVANFGGVGGQGTLASSGTGGAGNFTGGGSPQSGRVGGDYGIAGADGAVGLVGAQSLGGAGGRSVDGDSNITWTLTGIRTGAII